MINIEDVLKNDRCMKATMGLSSSEFTKIVKSFDQELENERWMEYEKGLELGDREKKLGGGRIESLKNAKEKLFLILFYFKCYPTFDVLGSLFDLNRSNAFRNIQKLTIILEKVLDKKMTLPKRKINNFEELVMMFPIVKNLFIDATERPIHWSSVKPTIPL